MGWKDKLKDKFKKQDISPLSIKQKVDKNLGIRDLNKQLGLGKVDEYVDQVTAWGDRPFGVEVFGTEHPLHEDPGKAIPDFDPDVYLGGIAGTPQGAGGQYGDWLGYEDTAIGKLYGTEYEQSPGYLFQLEEANKAAKQALAAQGLSGSGAEMKELQRLAQGMAAQDYGRWQDKTAAGFGDYLSGLQQMASGGQQAAVGTANAAGGYGANLANLAGHQAMFGAQQAANQGQMWGQTAEQLGQWAGKKWGNV